MSGTDDLFDNLPPQTLEQLKQLPNLKSAYEKAMRRTPAEIWFDKSSDTLSNFYSDTTSDSKVIQQGNTDLSVSETIAEKLAKKPRAKRPSRPWQTVYRYRSHEHWYYRYAWKDETGKHELHIPGGNWRSPVVKERVAWIRRQIKAGKSSTEIAEVICSWSF